LSLLLALFFFVSSISAFYVFAGQQTPVQCCDKDEAPPPPAEDGECFECQCLTCSAALSSEPDKKLKIISDPGKGNWLVVSNNSSDYIKLIEYPPETC